MKQAVKGSAENIAAELTMKERQEALILDSIPAIFYKVDPAGNLQTLWMSDQITKLTGFTPQAFTENPVLWESRLHPDDKEDVLGSFQNTLVDGGFSKEYRWQCADGSYRWFSDHLVIIRDEHGNPVDSAGVWVDITSRRHAEIALAENEHRYRLLAENLRIAEYRSRVLIENAPDGIVMINREGRFIFASPQAMHLFGYSQEEVKIYLPQDLTHPEDLPMVNETLMQLMQDPTLIPTIQYRFKHKAGNWFWIESTFSNLLATPGIEAIVINFRDITERKRMIGDLVNALRKAEESDRLKSVFLANMSHEIRTPMNAIVGFAEMLSDPDLTPENRSKFSGIIQSRSDDLMHIINDLLEISRIESGNVTVLKNEIRINKILTDLEMVFRQRLKRSNYPNLILQVEQALPDQQAVLNTDAYILKQVFSNLIENAIKYTPSGSIKFGYLTPSDGVVIFFVKDTGIGISQANQAVIFEHFRRADIENQHHYSGTGLGLAICKGSLAQIQGRIWVESEPGKGSTFYFTLPFDDSRLSIEAIGSEMHYDPMPAGQPGLTKDANPAVNARVVTGSPPQGRYCWPDKRLLIVEDEPANMEFLTIILQKTQVKITPVANGTLLRKQYDNLNNFDLVLLDVRLPDANGWELAKEIKTIRPGLPIIAQTAYAMSADLHKSLEAGCDNYISKPINKVKLLEMIAGYFG